MAISGEWRGSDFQLPYYNIQNSQFSTRNYKAYKKQEILVNSQENKVTEIIPEEAQSFCLLDRFYIICIKNVQIDGGNNGLKKYKANMEDTIRASREYQ